MTEGNFEHQQPNKGESHMTPQEEALRRINLTLEYFRECKKNDIKYSQETGKGGSYRFDMLTFEGSHGLSYFFEQLAEEPDSLRQVIQSLKEIFPEQEALIGYLEKRHLDPDSVLPKELNEKYPLLTERLTSAKEKRILLRHIDWAGSDHRQNFSDTAGVTEDILKCRKEGAKEYGIEDLPYYRNNPHADSPFNPRGINPGATRPGDLMGLEELVIYTQWQADEYRRAFLDSPRSFQEYDGAARRRTLKLIWDS